MTRVANLQRSFPTLILLGVPLRWIAKSRRRVLSTALLILCCCKSAGVVGDATHRVARHWRSI